MTDQVQDYFGILIQNERQAVGNPDAFDVVIYLENHNRTWSPPCPVLTYGLIRYSRGGNGLITREQIQASLDDTEELEYWAGGIDGIDLNTGKLMKSRNFALYVVIIWNGVPHTATLERTKNRIHGGFRSAELIPIDPGDINMGDLFGQELLTKYRAPLSVSGPHFYMAVEGDHPPPFPPPPVRFVPLRPTDTWGRGFLNNRAQTGIFGPEFGHSRHFGFGVDAVPPEPLMDRKTRSVKKKKRSKRSKHSKLRSFGRKTRRRSKRKLN